MGAEKNRTPKETWGALDKLRDDLEGERIASLSASEVDAELAEAGIDPAKLRSQASSFVERLLADREAKAKRPDWQAAAARGLADAQARFDARPPMPTLSRAQLEERLEIARRDPRFTEPARVMFRNKTIEQASDEELAAIVNELEALADETERKK